MDPIALKVIAAILVIVGIAGTVLPVLPGVTLVFGGLALAAWADDFQRVGVAALAILGALTVLAMIVDFAASAFGAKRMGASPRAVAGATAGALIGIFFGLPGLVIGPFAGAIIGELSANRALHAAGKAGLGTWVGLLLGAIAKLSLSFLMLGVFATAYLLSS
jgi:hypothetical protein